MGSEHLGTPERTVAFAAKRSEFPRRVSMKSRPRGWRVRTTDFAQRGVEHVLSGEMVVHCHGREARLTAGWTALTFRGTGFEMAAPARACEAFVVFNSTMRVEPVNPRPIVLPPDASLSRLARDVVDAASASDRFQLDATLAAGDHFAARAYQLAAERFERVELPVEHWLSLAQQLIDAHADSDRPLRDILAAVPIAHERLLQRLARRLGMPPRAYRIRRRVEIAKGLLAASQDELTAIALQLGYSSSQHFATEFRRVTGTTPSAFRAASRLPR
jgi:AraC-like DNA-binding protein